MQSILKAEALSKTYAGANGPLTVLHPLSFELAPGDTLAVVGPSGSGKTTLLGLLAGLDQPTQGEVYLQNTALSQLDEDQRAALRNAHVGFIFQNFQLLPSLTALENVRIPLELQGRRDKGQAQQMLEKVGLGKRLDHYPTQLSGGEQQRVALARAFVHHPELLFADEPTGNLDEATSATIEDLLFDLNREANTTLVIVTHDLELAAKCQRQLRLSGGRLVEQDGGAPASEEPQAAASSLSN